MDDILGAFETKEMADTFHTRLKEGFKKITGGTHPDWYLNCTFTSTTGGIEVGQEQLIDRIVRTTFGTLEGEHTAATPSAEGQKLKPAPENDELNNDEHKTYRKVVGMLLWLYCLTRPDIGFSTIQLCRYVSRPGKQHKRAMHRLVRYLARTKQHKLMFHTKATNSHIHDPGVDGGGDLAASSDCGFAANHDLTSNAAYLITYNGAVIAHKAWVIRTHLWSAHEGETVAASEAAREITYQRNIAEEIGRQQISQNPTKLFVDNSQTVIHANELRQTDKAKHIRLRDWYVRDKCITGEIQVVKAKGSDLAVDALTKALPIAEHIRHTPRLLGHNMGTDLP